MICLTVMPGPASLCSADQDIPHESLPTAWKSDAELTDVFFLDAKLGWAVGAQGVILRTTNGGKQWSEISQTSDLVADPISLKQKLQNIQTGARTRYTGIADNSSHSQQRPVRCRFESICFVDAKHGWIAGGYDVPYVNRSRAVVLQTQDGGLTWRSVRSLVIPRISKIHFFDQLNGWAVGRTGNLFQSGVFYTGNGGQTWSSKSSAKMSGWADAVKVGTGILAIDYDGKPGLLGSKGHRASVVSHDRPTKVNQVVMADAQQGWAAGEQGTMLKTVDGGRSFTSIGLDSSNAAHANARIAASAKQFDLKTLAVTSTKIWFAGDPGTLLFAIDRNTGQATARRLPIQSRINKIHFADDLNGWAVGALGCILSTQNGGETWTLQRGKHQTAAMLVINSTPESVGYELFSKYASQDDHLCASVLLDSTPRRYQAIRQATDRLGGSTSDLISASDQPEALKKLVRLIRSLQPRLIVLNTEPAGVNRSDLNDATRKIQILINEAIDLAANRSAFDQQIVDAGLKPWQVSRLATRDASGTVGIDARQLLPKAGLLIEDQIAISRAMSGQTILPEQKLSYSITELTNNGPVKAGDLLAGLGHDSSNSNTKRSSDDQRHGNLTAIHQASAKQKTFDQFLKFESTTAQDFQVWRQQVQSFAMKMDSEIAGVWLMQLAERYFAAGKPELAAASTELLVTRWSGHAFAPAALAWLAHYYGSDEFGQIVFLKRVQTGQLDVLLNRGGKTADRKIATVSTGKDFQTTSRVIQAGGGVSKLVWAPIKAETAADLKAANNDQGLPEMTAAEKKQEAKRQFFDARHQRAGMFLKQLGRRDPELIAGLQFKLMEAQLARQISGQITNEGRWKNLAQRRDLSGAGVAIGAKRELALGGFEVPSNRPVKNPLSCLVTQQRPKLDGKLNDACWQNVIQSDNQITASANLRSASTQAQMKHDVAMMAYDDKFLYVGLVCQKVQGHYYNLRKQARTRDPDLSRRDRIELTIDTNRDYRSAFKFVVDHRGWVNESCAGSRGWDPQWYVAQSEDELSWTAEVAIPLEQITSSELSEQTTWAFALKRKIFDDRNVWENESQLEYWQADEAPSSGLQIGLTANPAGFELLRFVDQQRDLSSQSDRADAKSVFDNQTSGVSSIAQSPGDLNSSGPNDFRSR